MTSLPASLYPIRPITEDELDRFHLVIEHAFHGSPQSASDRQGFLSRFEAQRSLAESMARHLWPSGVHVAVVIVDGVVDLARTRKMMPDQPDSFFVKPADLAESVLQVTKQPRSVWSFEVEARPFGERW